MSKKSKIVEVENDDSEDFDSDCVFIPKLDFEQVDIMFNALLASFSHDEGYMTNAGEALWNTYLCLAGWNEEEFFDEVAERDEHTCPECEAEKELKSKSKSN